MKLIPELLSSSPSSSARPRAAQLFSELPGLSQGSSARPRAPQLSSELVRSSQSSSAIFCAPRLVPELLSCGGFSEHKHRGLVAVVQSVSALEARKQVEPLVVINLQMLFPEVLWLLQGRQPGSCEECFRRSFRQVRLHSLVFGHGGAVVMVR
ncbi:unnamed protein product [Arabidopsis arenosa]|uniref:Uncharacterized protein n=1 Tax=Arabidopsis arenosa TaxID=38785 RepID=A0A8S2ACB3_ARAAE|nr:unnamed protein product [Arabidopsis arenosa]